MEKKTTVADGQPIAAMSHCVNNVLQGINGGSHLVELGLRKNDLAMVAQGWQIVKRNQVQISMLVMNLLVSSKPFEPSRESCDLRDIIFRSVENQAGAFELEQIEISIELGESECTASVDSQAMQLLFEDLLRIVLRAVRTFAQGFCKITASPSVNQIRVIINYGGVATSTNPLDAAAAGPDPTKQQFSGLELDVAEKIAIGHAGKLEFPTGPDGPYRIALSIPRS